MPSHLTIIPLIATIIFICSLVLGDGFYLNNKHIVQESNRYYKAFLHLESIGVAQCIKLCKRYQLCRKIHHDQKQLTCDLMMTYADKGYPLSLLDASKYEIGNLECSYHNCTDDEVCVDMKDGSHRCIVQDICPSTDWLPYNNKCYHFKSVHITADDNVDYCASMGAKPLRVDDVDVDAFIILELVERGWINVWLGANDRAIEDDWVWCPGDAVLNPRWNDGEPNGLDNENCVMFHLDEATPRWIDVPCSGDVIVDVDVELIYSVCEVPYSFSEL